MKIYHTETQADYDALMVELEGKGYIWASGRKPTESKDWVDHKEKTGVVIEKRITRAYIGKLKFDYPDTPIIKYKAKADEKMRFTKENVIELFDNWFYEQGSSRIDLGEKINALVDEPEKVVVPKFVAEFFKRKKGNSLTFLFSEFAIAEDKEVKRWYISQNGRFKSRVANAEDIIAKMYLYGYTIEPEKLYCIPLPDLETSDGLQQVLSKRENGENYFACRPTEGLQQRYTKEEIAQVPEIYKFYATLIEEEENE